MHLAPSTAWAWLIACAVVILLFPLAAQFGNLKGKLSSFHTWVWAIALLGIVTAGFMPFTFDADITHFEVQPFIFFITGTLLGVLFLGEVHRLSGLNKQEHTQRVHAERRTRYSKAVEQLAYPNPAVRASALSALAGLVDEWLADEQLSVEARQKEGQVIVNALCAYVRSPFSRAFKAEAFESDTPPANYVGDFATDLAAFRGEQDVRRSVFVEMSKRSSALAENEKGEVVVVPGAWSGFEFDFSRAVVFYPLDGLTIENAGFSAARFLLEGTLTSATVRLRRMRALAVLPLRGTLGSLGRLLAVMQASSGRILRELRSSVRRSLRGMQGLTRQPSTGIRTLAGLRLRGSLGSVMQPLRQARSSMARPLCRLLISTMCLS